MDPMTKAELTAFIDQLENASVADIIRLQIAINDKYEEKKKTTKNWSAAKWAILYPEKAKKNNLKQTHKARSKNNEIIVESE